MIQKAIGVRIDLLFNCVFLPAFILALLHREPVLVVFFDSLERGARMVECVQGLGMLVRGVLQSLLSVVMAPAGVAVVRMQALCEAIPLMQACAGEGRVGILVDHGALMRLPLTLIALLFCARAFFACLGFG